MNFGNPTKLRLGMNGTLAGRNFRVVGRVVMGMEDAGETYYWNEFNLRDDSGVTATLVFEETERGGQWKLFTLFEPEFPMTATDAATRKVGDPLNLDGSNVRVTLVDESRVYHIEGEAPEGVEVGDLARYFNAEAPDIMTVVSWTGDEVEYFHGANLNRSTVEKAFGLPPEPRDHQQDTRINLASSLEGGNASRWLKIVPFAVVVLVATIFIAQIASCNFTRRVSAVTRTQASPPALRVGSTGRLEQVTYRIVSRVRTEVSSVGRSFERHEYELVDDQGQRAWLIQGFTPGDSKAILFTPLTPSQPMTSAQAAALRAGTSVNVDGLVAPITEIFQSVVRQTEGDAGPAQPGQLSFGFCAQSGPTTLLVRWTDKEITFRQGLTKDLSAVKVVFNP